MLRLWSALAAAGAVLVALAGCSSSGAGGSEARASGDDVSDGGAVDGGAPSSVQPPIDDADTPTTEAGPGGPWIAFVSNRGGDFDIYLVHPDGAGLHPVVQAPGTDLYPAWSPDGTRIAFASDRASDAGMHQIYILELASGATTVVATDLVDAVSPAWSPDGTTLALGGPGGLYVVPATGGSATPLTTGGARDNSPAWSSSGDVVYFSSNRDEDGTFDVWSIQPDGGALQRVTTGAGIVGGPAPSRDGTTIALARAGETTEVALFALGTGTTTTLSAMNDSQPAFSPQGTRLAVTSARYAVDDPEIVVLDVTGATDPFRLTVSPGVDGQPAFQPAH